MLLAVINITSISVASASALISLAIIMKDNKKNIDPVNKLNSFSDVFIIQF